MSDRLGPPSATTAFELFALAVAKHGAGALTDAVRLYRNVLIIKPDSAEVLINLGMIGLAIRQYAAAAATSRRAIAINPQVAQGHFNLGMALLARGRTGAAIACYRNVLILAPDHPRAYHSLGRAFRTCGQLDAAAAALRRAVTVAPRFPEAFTDLAAVLLDRHQYDGALTALRNAVTLQPYFADALNQIGMVFDALGRTVDADAAYRQALAIRPDFAEAFNNRGILLSRRSAHRDSFVAFARAIRIRPAYAEVANNLGNALQALGKTEPAVICFRLAVVLKPDYAGAYNNLGNCLRAMGRMEPALTSYRRSLTLSHLDSEAHSNLGNVLRELGHYGEALTAYRDAIRRNPDALSPHLNYAMALLQQGRFAEGWQEYEWRKRAPDFMAARLPTRQPEWSGEPLEGRTLLLFGEQGFGDVLQFCRYAPLLAAQGARVLLRVAPMLVRLLRTLPSGIDVATTDAAIPPFDFHLPLLSIPAVVGTDLDSIPANVPYLHADPDAAAAWRRRLATLPGLKVGLVWAGNPRTHVRDAYLLDRQRSMPLASFAPLGAIPAVNLISLQKGPPAVQARTPPAGLVLHDWTDELGDFADTAALVDALDLVITVDTAVAHLVGALGKPVWILSRFDGCWRWLLARNDSPWYPTARLFRQQRPGDWTPVVDQVVRTLSALQKCFAAAATAVTPAGITPAGVLDRNGRTRA